MTQAVEYRQRGDGIWVISRDSFVQTRFDYKPGQHVTFGGPSQHGKTTLAFELLEYCATSECPAYIAVSKPMDPVTEREGKRLGYRRVSEWPAPKKFSEILSEEKPRGYIVWPKFGDIDEDVARASRVTTALIDERYAAGAKRKGKGILVMDDTMLKVKVLGLDRKMVTILAMAGAMGLGMWVFVQKPTDSGSTPIWGYGASEHLFISHDADANSRKRYDEIGGVDPKQVAAILASLEPFQFLYIKRTERYMCIVDSK